MKKTVLAVVISSILVLFYESANKTMADYAEAKSKEAIVHLESDAKNFTSKDILFTLHSVNGAGSAQAKNSWLIIGFS
ncbi:MAG TPA: hypothetical protein VL728_18745, partial [Cyclobacteriaceae bacterium]|nr:hypothetical protein [Cyclobacteriaceae bacterium]